MLLCTPSPVSCIPGWPGSFYVAKDDLELIFPPPPPLGWNQSHAPSCLRVPRAPCLIVKRSTNRAMLQLLWGFVEDIFVLEISL